MLRSAVGAGGRGGRPTDILGSHGGFMGLKRPVAKSKAAAAKKRGLAEAKRITSEAKASAKRIGAARKASSKKGRKLTPRERDAAKTMRRAGR